MYEQFGCVLSYMCYVFLFICSYYLPYHHTTYMCFIIFVFPILFANEKGGEDIFLVVVYYLSL